MPTPVKNTENMTKHMTQEELEARQQAEEQVTPSRKKLKLKKPEFVRDNRVANGYWNQILKRMEGLVLLDDLDSEILAGYCSMLARRDQTIQLVNSLMTSLGVAGAMDTGKKSKKSRKDDDLTDEEYEASAVPLPPPMTADELIEAVSKLDTLNMRLQNQEKTVLQYAEKLGLTPSGRVRLAQKRAQAAAAETEPDADLYGD